MAKLRQRRRPAENRCAVAAAGPWRTRAAHSSTRLACLLLAILAGCERAPTGDGSSASRRDATSSSSDATAASTRPDGEPNEPASSAPADLAQLPHIVIFLVDTLRADRLGTYGYTARRTSPRIDELAAESVVFEQASSAAPWTLPSVASLFTSTFACEHQLIGRRQRLNRSLRTLAQHLRATGYTTVSMVANAFAGREFGLGRGFQRVVPSVRNNADKVRRMLPERGERLFLYIHNMEPHDPHHYAPESLEGFERVDEEARRWIRLHFNEYKRAGEFDYRRQNPLGTNDLTEAQDDHLAGLRKYLAQWNALYDASVFVADRRVGSVIDLLKRRGLWDDTLFILLADHGEEFGEHGGWLHDQSVYQELLHVPLIVHLPRGEHAGRRIAEPVSLVDVMPTILAYVGQSARAAGARGRDLMPLMRGGVSPGGGAPRVVGMRMNTTRFYRPWESLRGGVNVAIRSGAWKGVWNQAIDTLELYDLGSDPGERTNVADGHEPLVTAMRSMAEQWYAECMGSKQEAEVIEVLDEETLRNLRELGYVE